jgi:serine/threonine-protein kinase
MADPSPDAPVPDPFEGTSYRAIRRIGEGGMSEVFVVEHVYLGRHFAAKLLHGRLAKSPDVVDRMRLEAQTLGRLDHPNVVAIQGFDTTADGRPYLVIELLQGRPLTEALRTHGAMPVDLAVHYAIQLLSGLEAAHEIGVVHRDVKPDNIFLANDPNGRVPELKLIDFGIARVLPGATEAPAPLTNPTATGAVVGTPRFLSPEGALGQRVDARADLYGAALVLYTMLAGRGPFDHVHGDRAVMGAHANETPVPPSQQTDEPVPAELDALLLKALSKDPNARFASAPQFRKELEKVVSGLGRPAGWLATTTYYRRTAPVTIEPERAPSPSRLAEEIVEIRAAIPSRSGASDQARAKEGRASASEHRRSDRSKASVARRRLSRRALAIVVLFAVVALVVSVMAVVSVGMRLRGQP